MGKTTRRGRPSGPTPRPSIREVDVEVVREGRLLKRKGANLSDVLGGIIWDEMQQLGMGQEEIGAYVGGISQQHVSNLLRQKKGTSLEVLSKVCAAYQKSPGELFEQHERYLSRKSEDAQAQFAVDQVYNRFRSLIGVDTARRLAVVLDALNRSGPEATETFLKAGEQMAGIPKGSAAGSRSRSSKTRKK